MSEQSRITSGGSVRRAGGHRAVGAIVVWCAILVLSTLDLAAQSRLSWNWYFGQHAGITFRNGAPETLDDGLLNTNEGCATVSDPNTGELLFYTDGVTVWNRLHEVMPNGTGLFGDASTSQSAIIVPAPGRPNVYYIFTPAPITASNPGARCMCLTYSIVDMRADAGFGDVVTKNEILLNDITEHLTATADCRGDGFWIVVRSRTSRHFYSIHLTRDQLVTTPVVSDAGLPSIQIRDAGQMHISRDSRRLVITSAAGASVLYDFDAQTGKVTNGVNLFPGDAIGSHYGAAFSADGRKLYVAVANETPLTPTRIYQFSIDMRDAQALVDSRYLMGELPGVFTWAPMQLAPDERIYIGRFGQPWLASIDEPSLDTSAAGFNEAAIRLTGSCRLGLPNIVGSTLIEPGSMQPSCSLPRADLRQPPSPCAGRCVGFQDASTGSIDTWLWTFEGASPSSSVERNPRTVCYTRPGDYTVRLIVSNAYGADTAVSTITVRPSPSVSVADVAEICPGAAVVLTASGADEYTWSPAHPLDKTTGSQVIARPLTTTRFTVVGTNAYGCSDTATVLVSVTTMNASGDATICKGASTVLAASGADSYAWLPTDGLSDPSVATPTASPGSTTSYVVTMRKGNCLVKDTVLVTVVDTFEVSILGTTAGCEGDTLVLRSSAGTAHAWSGSGLIDTLGPLARVRIGSSPTRIHVRSSTGGCVDTTSVVITPYPLPTISLGPDTRVCIGEATILTATTNGSDVRWAPADGLDRTSGAIVTASPTVTTAYVATVRGDSGCIAVDTIVVEVLPRPFAEAGPDLSICVGTSVTLDARSDADRVEWTPAVGLSDPTALRPVATPTVTTTYVLRALSNGCESFDTVTVFVSSIDLRASSDTSICLGESVMLVATGAVRYEWSPATGLSDPSSDRPVASPSATTTYTVIGTDAFGCRAIRTMTVSVRDTVALRIVAGTTAARAGSEDLGIPIFVEVPASMLPLRIGSLRATLVNPVSVFLPDSTDRGALRTSVRGDDRLSYLLVENVQVITPRQKVTEVRGLVLAGGIETAILSWEDVEWSGQTCPTITAQGGLLYVTGCNITGRMLRSFGDLSVTVLPQPASESVNVRLVDGMRGRYTVRLVDADGRVLHAVDRERSTEETLITLPMGTIASGLYGVQIIAPMHLETVPVVWVR